MAMGIGALARATGVKVETIRYYERIGLLAAPSRTEGGHRQYGDGELRRLSFIRRARQLGFTLDEVRGLLQLADGGGGCEAVRTLAQGHLRGVRERIVDLQRLAGSLEQLVARCGETGRADHCPLVDDLFRG